MKFRSDLSYKYCSHSGDTRIFLVLHGGGAVGIESTFISRIVTVIADSRRSVFAFNMPYCEHGEENTSEGLVEETDALGSAIDYLRKEGYNKITIIGKSLGGIVASFYLEKYPDQNIDLAILGYVIGDVKDEAAARHLKLVIQGELDRFGGSREVKKTVKASNATVIGIAEADHSYRDTKGAPAYQTQAIEILLENL